MPERLASSFRDPAGFVFTHDGEVYRQVNASHEDDFASAASHGLHQALHERGLLIDHETVEVAAPEPRLGSLVIKPTQVPFISYPYEWTPGQLRAAALATLEIELIALEHGFTLRDASAYNIQFVDGRPCLIDTLSLGPMSEGEPWEAYGQFCRHFLAPLALIKYVDVRLAALSRLHLDGIPLDLASQLLPGSTRARFGMNVHLHAHAASQRRHADAGDKTRRRTVSMNARLGLVESLKATVRKLSWEPSRSAWSDYYQARESYSEQGLVSKEQAVRRFVAAASPTSIWDLGANTGHFSRVAADESGAQVVAFEMDYSAAEIAWRDDKRPPRVLPLVTDLSNPAPSQGWAHQERSSLQARGPCDLVLALALVHHLAIGNNVPLTLVLQWFATLAPWLVIEWVPKSDPMVTRLLSSRQDVFDGYDDQAFELAASRYFEIVERAALDGGRTLYLLRRP